MQIDRSIHSSSDDDSESENDQQGIASFRHVVKVEISKDMIDKWNQDMLRLDSEMIETQSTVISSVNCNQ